MWVDLCERLIIKKCFFLADEILSDEKKRTLYDQVGEQGMIEHMGAEGFCDPVPSEICNKFFRDGEKPFDHEKDCKVS
jgi:DnaJ-class molecular chaperone